MFLSIGHDAVIIPQSRKTKGYTWEPCNPEEYFSLLSESSSPFCWLICTYICQPNLFPNPSCLGFSRRLVWATFWRYPSSLTLINNEQFNIGRGVGQVGLVFPESEFSFIGSVLAIPWEIRLEPSYYTLGIRKQLQWQDADLRIFLRIDDQINAVDAQTGVLSTEGGRARARILWLRRSRR